MRKNLLMLLSFFLLFGIFNSIAAEKENNVVTVTSGKESIKDITASKNVYVYVTFNNTLLWKETQTVDEFLKSRKNRGDKAKETNTQ